MTQRSDAGEARTCGHLVSSQALYHCAPWDLLQFPLTLHEHAMELSAIRLFLSLLVLKDLVNTISVMSINSIKFFIHSRIQTLYQREIQQISDMYM